ncbi:anthranilate phosphoribosyltransferase [Kiritimatiella glycovorans]|uniref:Anthranilate phosphoribosyltransferase n=1 Tax=Kiritimatiella glycovorans TaxID=1307763 RepID=A0A0G3EHS3_9BACT|nr:anthranilate phosphoribosyltransferase [Kiritimatiella glycovorans]AKJ64972.1 Anthranilate phosphoribosyltransferase [Kiritimatiella glycovorans]
MIRECVHKLLAGEALSEPEAYETMGDIMEDRATDAQIGAYLAALRLRGLSSPVFAGSARAMRERAVPVASPDPVTVDIVGTGGDGSHTFNISTTAAFVAAGAGVTVAKHGSYGVSSRCGSADVLAELGVNIKYPPETMERGLREIGLAFLFAPSLHPAMKRVVGPRRELGFWSLFNVLGPLCNPARAAYGVLGVFRPDLVAVAADAAAHVGVRHLYVVHGQDGLDEISTTAPTFVREIRGERIESYEIAPAAFGLTPARSEDLAGGDPAVNAEMIRQVLEGDSGPRRDIVLLNAAFALAAAGKADSPKEALPLAAESIDSGAAMSKLEQLRELS